VGGGAAFTEAAVPADRPPTPDPSPPLRGGRGEDNGAAAGMNAGRIDKLGTPQEIHESPKSGFVARFIGASNVIKAVARDEHHIALVGATLELVGAKLTAGQNAVVAIRQHDIQLATQAPQDLNDNGDLAAISVLGVAMLAITFAVALTVNRIPMFGGNAGARPRDQSIAVPPAHASRGASGNPPNRSDMAGMARPVPQAPDED
jgi:hypothetical protein